MVKKATHKKIYVLDTNVLLHDPRALESFEGVTIGIPAAVLEELDTFKREGTDRGRNTREVIRQLDALRERGSIGDGVKLDNGGTLRVLFPPLKAPHLPFELKSQDNEIILTALTLKLDGYDVKLITKDLNVRVKADALGIATEDYLKEYVTEEEFYQGWVRIPVPSLHVKGDQLPNIEQLIDVSGLVCNEFVILESKNNPYNNRVFRYLGGKKFAPVYPPSLHWPLKPKNVQQMMALDLLLDDSVLVVALLGPAGTGKTFMALLAGLHKVLVDNVFEKMLISRPIVPLGRDIGYLPGDVKEKLQSWMLPIYDNMDFIVHSASLGRQANQIEDSAVKHEKMKNKRLFNKKKHEHRVGGIVSLDELMHKNKISMEAITYMRGRSIPYQYILIDEAQNLTPHEVKTIISRVGEGSKIILAGDPYQIDSPYLDFSSNGLIVASEKFKGQRIFGSVYLPTSERSEVARLAAELL